MRRNPAFTLIEILVVIALLGIVLTVGLFNLQSSRENLELKAAAEQLADMIRRAHIFAREYKNEKTWAVASADTTSYQLLARDKAGVISNEQLIILNSNLSFENTFTIWFNRGTGTTSKPETITLKNPSSQLKINISPTGVVDVVSD